MISLSASASTEEVTSSHSSSDGRRNSALWVCFECDNRQMNEESMGQYTVQIS